MDDVDIGGQCWAAYGQHPGTHVESLRALGARAREFLAKPAATRGARGMSCSGS